MYHKAVFYKRLDNKVMCNTCIRRCILGEGQRGFCGNYMNIGNMLYNIGYGYISAHESRPIEIKPLFHFNPGSTAYTFSGWGCNFKCRWCQNWSISMYNPGEVSSHYIEPDEMVEYALKAGDDGVCASFNEPTIHLEYLLDVFRLSREKGLYNVIVSNFSFTREALDLLIEAGLDAVSLDIKGCPYTYRRFLGIREPEVILENAKYAMERGVHIESVFLVVTDANDRDECIKWVIDSHIKYLGVDTPLHINRYYPSYKYSKPATSLERLMYAYKYAKSRGIRYVYIGNIPSNEYMITRCPNCGEPLIIRDQYRTLKCRLDRGNKCPKCGYKINIKGICRETKKSFYF